MDEIKNKIKNVINKPILTVSTLKRVKIQPDCTEYRNFIILQKQVKVPEMGFSEYFIQHVSLVRPFTNDFSFDRGLT